MNARLLKNYFHGIWNDRYILLNFVKKDLQQKYRKSKLGVLWSILTPLCLVIIIGLVYSVLFGSSVREFIPTLYSGLTPWLFISGSIDGSTMSFIAAEGYIKQTTVSRQIYPLRGVCVNFVNLLYSIVAYFCIYLFLNPNAFGPRMLLLLPSLIILFFFVLGMSNFAALINLNIRDFAPLQNLILQALFYVTPIIYEPKRMLDLGFPLIYQLNPFYYIIEIIRRPLKGLPSNLLGVYLIATSITVLVFFSSVIILMKHEKEIVFKL